MRAAVAARLEGRHQEALGHVEEALRIERRNAVYHVMAGECHEALGAAGLAVASYRRALQFAPNDAFTLCRLGHCERRLGHASESVRALERALLLQPASAEILNELALALLQAGRRDEAVARLRAALAADPSSGFASRNLAKILYVAHVEETPGAPVMAAEALAALEDALRHDAADAELRHLRDALRGDSPPRPPAEFVATFFDRFAAQFDDKLRGLGYRAPEVAQEVLGPRLARRRGRVVDLGCGTGLAAGMLRLAASVLVGVDLSAEMLARARERGGYDELVHEDIVEYLRRQPAGSIDTALALDVFIYVGDMAPAVETCALALAPGGLFAFTVELLQEEGAFRLRASGRYAHHPADVRALCARCGLVKVESRELDIRHEAGKPVNALLLAFEKPPQ